MTDDELRVLDNLIERIKKGETIESCLADYPTMNAEMKALLHTALSIFSIPKVSMSDEQKTILKARFMRQLRKQSIQGNSRSCDKRSLTSTEKLETPEHSQKETFVPA